MFSFSLDIFFGGLEISKLQFLISNKSFLRQYCWSGEVLFKFFQPWGEKKTFSGKWIKRKNLLTGAAAPLGEVAGQLALSFRHLLLTHQQAHHSSAHRNHVSQCCGSGSASGSISQRYGSGSGSFYNQAKKVRIHWFLLKVPRNPCFGSAVIRIHGFISRRIWIQAWPQQ
jgi:hypothetical protein